MPIPAIVWVGAAALTFFAGAGTGAAVGGVADDFGDAAEKTGTAVSRIALSVGALGLAYAGYQNRAAITSFVKKVL